MPFAVAEDRIGERREQPLVERPELGIGGLVGPAGEEDRQRTVRPSSWPSCTMRAPVWDSAVTAAARALPPGKAAAARGSSWFSMKRTRRDW